MEDQDSLNSLQILVSELCDFFFLTFFKIEYNLDSEISK